MTVSRSRKSFAATLVLLAAAACNSGPNPTDNISKALKASNFNEVSVTWDRSAHIAHLKGTVDRSTDRARAEEVATAAAGSDGKVLNEITIKGLNEKTAGNLDGDIKDQLRQMVKGDPILRDRNLSFDVNNGVVTVKGDVQTADEKTKVTDLVRAAPGVKDMANAVEIKPKT
jgi:osmotically-inducible protein OsmY